MYSNDSGYYYPDVFLWDVYDDLEYIGITQNALDGYLNDLLKKFVDDHFILEATRELRVPKTETKKIKKDLLEGKFIDYRQPVDFGDRFIEVTLYTGENAYIKRSNPKNPINVPLITGFIEVAGYTIYYRFIGHYFLLSIVVDCLHYVFYYSCYDEDPNFKRFLKQNRRCFIDDTVNELSYDYCFKALHYVIRDLILGHNFSTEDIKPNNLKSLTRVGDRYQTELIEINEDLYVTIQQTKYFIISKHSLSNEETIKLKNHELIKNKKIFAISATSFKYKGRVFYQMVCIYVTDQQNPFVKTMPWWYDKAYKRLINSKPIKKTK